MFLSHLKRFGWFSIELLMTSSDSINAGSEEIGDCLLCFVCDIFQRKQYFIHFIFILIFFYMFDPKLSFILQWIPGAAMESKSSFTVWPKLYFVFSIDGSCFFVLPTNGTHLVKSWCRSIGTRQKRDTFCRILPIFFFWRQISSECDFFRPLLYTWDTYTVDGLPSCKAIKIARFHKIWNSWTFLIQST